MTAQHQTGNHAGDSAVKPMPDSFMNQIEEQADLAGGAFEEDEMFEGAIGRTMFDTPSSRDNTVTVLLPPAEIGRVPAQSLVRIKSRPKVMGGDGRQYLGAVVEGPFAEPDGLKADAPIVVTTTVRGAMFMPKYHGRIQVEILGEEIDGTVVPPRFRPLPNSPVFALDEAETEERLKISGGIRLGLAVGYENMPVCLPADRKDVFPRHTSILGTTGGGKSTTVSGLVGKLSASGVATVIFDTEGEYTEIMHPTEDANMLAALNRRGLSAQGVQGVRIYHLVGRETTNKGHNDVKTFGLEFSNLAPQAVVEILGLNEAQEERYQKAYDITRQAIMEFKIFGVTKDEQDRLLEMDEQEEGFPKMRLSHMYDVVRLTADVAGKTESSRDQIRSSEFKSEERFGRLCEMVRADKPLSMTSWRKVQGSLSRLLRLNIFDNPKAKLPDYDAMTMPGRVTIMDLSDMESPQIRNLVIAEILRGLRHQQELNYEKSEQGEPMRRVNIVIEEAHEFLSAERIKQMPVLFQQVARIARRGRKRWLGLTFVTQLPQHLPDEVLGLVNNHILHKIADANVISRLKRSIGGIDDSLWNRLPNLAPGQAIVSAASMARPLLVAIDPAPCKLRMVN